MILFLLSLDLMPVLNEIDSIYQESYLDNSLYDKASSMLDSLYKLYPDNIEVIWRKSYFCYLKGVAAKTKDEKLKFFKQGQELGKKGIEIDSMHPEPHYWYAVNRAKEGEIKGVLNSLFMVDELKKEGNLVLKLDPKHAGAYVLLGSIYNALPSFAGGDRNKAIEYLKKAIHCDTTYNAAYMTLAEIYINSKKYSEARELLKSFLNIKKPRDKRLFYLTDKKKAEDLLNKIEGK